jgi:hypothetical protein
LIASVILIITPTIYWFFQAKFTDYSATTSTGIGSYNAPPMLAIIHMKNNDLKYKNSELQMSMGAPRYAASLID